MTGVLGRAARAGAAAALLLAAGCHRPEGRLEDANALRVKGDAKGALARYKALLSDLGEAPLPEAEAQVRLKALRFAGDVSYLELGDYQGAIGYYRRIVSLYPGQPAYEARALLGEILQDRFEDRLGAVAQWAEIARSTAPDAAKYQFKIARAYLELKKYEQAKVEARVVPEKWPGTPLADEAQLLAGQAAALEKEDGEAVALFEGLLARRPAPDLAARALEAEAHLFAQQGSFDRALQLYELALPNHPNPETVRTAIEAVRERRDRARPGDRASAFK